LNKGRLPAVNVVHKGMGLQTIRIGRRGEESKNFSTWHLGIGIGEKAGRGAEGRSGSGNLELKGANSLQQQLFSLGFGLPTREKKVRQ